MYDDSIISFITCVNDDNKYKRCVDHINALNVPNRFSIEVITMKNASSMCSGYNQALSKAKGKYKVYLHQDVYIINENFIKDVLDIFTDSQIGMIGMAGAKDIPSTGRYSASNYKYGHLIHYMIPGNRELWAYGEFKGKVETVLCIDGLLMATQYDIRWNEELFDHWHFYDMSQSIEYNRAGYGVVVPYMSEPWCIHDCGKSDYRRYKGYDKERLKFIDNYEQFLIEG